MTTDMIERCALSITSRTLSDYRSDGLSANEMARLRAHVEECPNCQARIEGFAAAARELRDHPELDGHIELWRDVRASIAAQRATPAAREYQIAHHTWRLPTASRWTTVGSLVAVVALSIGFLAVFVSHGGLSPATKPTPTPITIHSGRLTWKQVIVPKGFPDVNENASATVGGPTIAQSDGETMYACQANARYTPAPRVWATHDAGAHWSAITPTGVPANTGGCRVWVDSNDASVLIVNFFPVLGPQQPAPPTQWVTYASFDGGGTWSKPAGLQDGKVTYALASAPGRIYAQRTSSLANGMQDTGLYVSSDQMRSWTRIDATLPETRPNPPDTRDIGKVFEMWANPRSDEALVLTGAGSLWSTVDDGAHWTRIAYPKATNSQAPMLMVGAPATSARLTICGMFSPIQSSATDQWFECTTDNGQNWIRRPPSTAAPTYHLFLAGLGADGSLYATALTPSSAGGETDSTTIYRLPPGGGASSDWQPLGVIPDSQHGGAGWQIAPSGASTVIWVFPNTGTITSGANTKSYTQPYYYFATYP